MPGGVRQVFAEHDDPEQDASNPGKLVAEVTDTSQYGEGAFIVEHFAGRVGRFLDIGAFDGVTLSNTRMLYDAGWSGVLVEPDPLHFGGLLRNYPETDRAALVLAAIVPCKLDTVEGRPRPFWHNCGDVPSTFVIERGPHFSASPYRKMWVVPMTIHGFRQAFGTDFQFVNIDVEGLNVQVFQAVLAWMRAEMICVEIDPEERYEFMRVSAQEADYPNEKRIGGNLLVWR